MRGLKERGRWQILGLLFGTPSLWGFAAAAEGMNEVVSGWCLERHRFVSWCGGSLSPGAIRLVLAQRVPPDQSLHPVPIDQTPRCYSHPPQGTPVLLRLCMTHS